MTNAKSRIIAAVAGALTVGTAAAWAAEPSQQAQIQALEAKVAALEAKQADNTATAAAIDSVLRDAERRSQLLAVSGDQGAGYDNGFYIRAGEWTLRPGALFQFWNVTDFRQDTDGAKSDEIDNGFEVHRMKLILEGTAFTRDLEYSFIWDTERDGGGVFLEDAWAKYMFSDQWGIRAGQFKDPVSHEWLVNDGRQLAAERSMLNEVLGGGFEGRTQGATIVYGDHSKNNPLNVEAGLTDGLGEQNTNFTKHTFDFGVAGRAEYLVMGDWKNYADFSAMNTAADLLVIGVGGDWSQAGDGNVWTATVDAQYENTAGLGVYGGLIYRHVDGELLGAPDDNDDWGGVIQVGYMLNPQWEIFGRYDYTRTDVDVASAGDEDNFHELTAGVNYFMFNGAAHRAKITADLSYFPNGVPGALFDNTIIGAEDANNGSDEWVARVAFQLWI